MTFESERITGDADRLVIVFAVNFGFALLIGAREGVLIADDALLIGVTELDGSTEGVERVETLLQTKRLLRFDRRRMIVVVNFEVGRLDEDQVAADLSAAVLACGRRE